MDGIKNLLQILNDNWTTILVCAGLIVGLVQRTIKYFSKTNEERVEIAKAQIEQSILKMITDAESNYEDWNKAGEIKRSQVIGKIFAQYPILSKVTNQAEIIDWIDREIDNSLKTLENLIIQNKSVG